MQTTENIDETFSETDAFQSSFNDQDLDKTECKQIDKTTIQLQLNKSIIENQKLIEKF
jgi:hypothetical protein